MTKINEEYLKHVPQYTPTQYHNDRLFFKISPSIGKIKLKEFKRHTKD